MIVHLVRAVYLLVVLAFTTSYAFQDTVYLRGSQYTTMYVLIPSLGAFALVMVDMFWRRKHLQVLSGLFFGLLAGLVIAYAMGMIIDMVGNVFTTPTGGTQTVWTVPPSQSRYQREIGPKDGPDGVHGPAALGGSEERSEPDKLRTDDEFTRKIAAARTKTPIRDLIKVLLGVSAVFLSVSFVLQTKDDFRFIIPYVEFAKQTKGARPILLDTSVIIDGRISDIAESRILESQVIVPRFILEELQSIADSDDKLKRNRGRRGLDILNRLRESDYLDLQVLDMHVPTVDEVKEVDSKLVALAKHLDGRIVTNDYNLNKIARLRGVDVININDLANALKPVVLPGEAMKVKIIKRGEESGQGVGYLEDGTMVVVEQARDQVNCEVIIAVTSVLQTSAGRMIFGRLDAEKTSNQRNHQG